MYYHTPVVIIALLSCYTTWLSRFVCKRTTQETHFKWSASGLTRMLIFSSLIRWSSEGRPVCWRIVNVSWGGGPGGGVVCLRDKSTTLGVISQCLVPAYNCWRGCSAYSFVKYLFLKTLCSFFALKFLFLLNLVHYIVRK